MGNSTLQHSKSGEFFSLADGNPEQRAGLANSIAEVNASGGSYHRLDFGDGIVLNGDYDMNRYLAHYNLPADLSGCTVLDAGAASGFFSMECARRGGAVTAIDVHAGNWLLLQLREMSTDIRYIQKNIYDLDPQFGSFDLVICGSVLLHLPDPVGAMRKLRSVCRKQLIVSTTCPPDSATNAEPICVFHGARATEGDYWHYWTINAEALRRMLLAAGFTRIESPHHFLLETEPMRKNFFVSPHVVLSAFL